MHKAVLDKWPCDPVESRAWCRRALKHLSDEKGVRIELWHQTLRLAGLVYLIRDTESPLLDESTSFAQSSKSPEPAQALYHSFPPLPAEPVAGGCPSPTLSLHSATEVGIPPLPAEPVAGGCVSRTLSRHSATEALHDSGTDADLPIISIERDSSYHGEVEYLGDDEDSGEEDEPPRGRRRTRSP